MDRPHRRTLLCAQEPPLLTGIDFVHVVDPGDQRTLRVYFIVEPDALQPPLVTPASLADPANGAENLAVSIQAVIGGAARVITRTDWRAVTFEGVQRTCLEIEVDEPGGFEPYRLTLRHLPGGAEPHQLDPFFASTLFDFKQGCPTGFDCAREPREQRQPGVDFPVDYLARDFESFRRALLDFAAQRYPHWREPIEADFAVMLLEIMAAMGDEFAYAQDRADAETRFGSATQRASLFALARLVDHAPDPGLSARGEVVLTASGEGTVPADAVVWAMGPGGALVPFSFDAGLWVHPLWNELTVHDAGLDDGCLPRGRTSVLLVSPAAVAGSTPPDPTNPAGDTPLERFLVGRRAMLISAGDAPTPARAWPVTVSAVDELEDPLLGSPPDSVRIVRIGWSASEATPFDLPLAGLRVCLNVAGVTAGEQVVEHVRMGWHGGAGEAEHLHGPLPDAVKAALADVPRLIEREGPYARATGGERAIVARHGLAATEASSLRFAASGLPSIAVEELAPRAVPPNPLPSDALALLSAYFDTDEQAPRWQYLPDLLDGHAEATSFTVEPGMWRTVETHQLQGRDLAFRDYAGDRGWTLTFSFGDFGRPPADGALLRVRYHTDPGPAGNVASHAIALSHPQGPPAQPELAKLLSAATNPLPINNARAGESPNAIRLNAPHAYRARPRRAVRPEDYRTIIERQHRGWVQQAQAVTRWTGSWQTDFVSVDPLDAIALSDEQHLTLANEIDCIRLTGRDARLAEATYRDVDIEVRICVAAGFYAGDVVERVRERLAPPGFFAPANFTYGDPLRRSALEAAVQEVAGVAHVDSVRVRVHGSGGMRPFEEPELSVQPNEVIRLQDDPNRSTLGLLRVTTAGVM